MQLADAPLCDSTGVMDVMEMSQRRKQVFLINVKCDAIM